MPHYDYICQACGDATEVFQSMKDEALSTCDKCGGRLKRLIGGGAGIIFKGTGFYKTDYRNEPAKCENKSAENPACASCPATENKKA